MESPGKKNSQTGSDVVAGSSSNHSRRSSADADVADSSSSKSVSLQESFIQYKKRRQEQMRQAKKLKETKLKTRADGKRMQELRLKFVEQAKRYFGTPYAKKYWQKDEAEYNAPLFLDCCGLVRKIMKDLEGEFGFHFGPWNQAYQYDTLPITIEDKKDMKPGDLVFIAATYNNPKSKKQKHDMVHVEIWLGEGDKTIGARWQRGKVQVHDSYDFEAKSYHSPTYIFKSIDTWLMGLCQSHCDVHPWRLPSEYDPAERSIFYSDSLQDQANADMEDVDASDSEGEDGIIQSTPVVKQSMPQSLASDLHPTLSDPPILTQEVILQTAKVEISVRSSPNKLDISHTDIILKSGNHTSPIVHEDEIPSTSYHSLNQQNSPKVTLISGPVYFAQNIAEGNTAKPNTDLELLPNTTVKQKVYHYPEDLPGSSQNTSVNSGPKLSPNTDSRETSDGTNTSLCDDVKTISIGDIMHENSSILAEQAAHLRQAQPQNSEPANLDLAALNTTQMDIPVTIDIASRNASSVMDSIFANGNRLSLVSYEHTESESSSSSEETEKVDSPEELNDQADPTDSIQGEPSSRPKHQEQARKPAIKQVTIKSAFKVTSSSSADVKWSQSQKTSAVQTRSRARSSTKTSSSVTGAAAVTPVRSKSSGTEGKRSRKAQHNARLRALSIPTQSSMASYQICGGNGGPIVDNYLASLGWKKIADKQNFNWKLKWVEVNSQVNFGAFRDGEQLVNRIPNCSLLTNKLGLFNSLSEYSRVLEALQGNRCRMRMSDFVPETYRIDQNRDREQFLEIYKDGEIWICKPTGLNQGKGIFLVRSVEQIEKMLADREQRKQARRTKPLMALIVQRYIERPLLVEKKKFDIRAYMVIPSTIPFLVFYHRGYVRVTCEEYDLDNFDLSVHLTNQFVQKKNENYKEVKEDTVWSMERFNQYVNDTISAEKNIEQDWVLNYLEKQIKSIMKYCFNAVKHKLNSRLGLFDIYGLDFMIDENMKVWLIEINVNPAMHTNCDVLKEALPPILEETVDCALECFERTKKNLPILPLQSLKTFQVLYNGCPKSSGQSSTTSNNTDKENTTNASHSTGGGAGGPPAAKASQSPVRSQAATRRSASPSKEQGWGYISRSPVKSSKQSHSAEQDTRGAPGGNPGIRGALYQSSPTLRGAANSNPVPSINRSLQQPAPLKPESKPIVGTNYIKSNIANLGNIAQRRRSRYHRLNTGPAIASGDELDPSSQAPDSLDHLADRTDGIMSPSNNQETENQQSIDDFAVEGEPSQALYNKLIPNAAPVGPQQITARARGSTQTTATASGAPPQQILTVASTLGIPPPSADFKTTEQILRELKDYRPKTPLLPPLYTIRSDVATLRTVPNQHTAMYTTQVVAAVGSNPEIALQGYPAISNNGGEASSSPVRLCMVHAAYAQGKARSRNSPAGSFTTVSRKYPRDRAS